MSHVNGKVVVVTGAAGGFGLLTAGMLAERGATVVGFDVQQAAGCRAVDVTDRSAVQSAVDQVVAEHGRVDVLVNNAGVMPLAFLADHERAADAWDRCIDVNLKGVLHGIYAAYDHMVRQGGGHIVNIASIYGNYGVAGAAVYGATKAAVVTLSNALRVEAQGKIKVTVVRPTGVPGTGLAAGILDMGAVLPLAGHNAERMVSRFGGMGPELRDPEDVRYWAISPEELAAQIVYAIDQPAGVAISDITVRATGEDYVF
ncbi:MAG TPA: SDR family oxidoreductase [Acidimicrobiales bacterium]|nr:SDR family oxidoreductase [Acidimicrobiales bacterium]